MNTKTVPQPYRGRIKRAQRKLATATARQTAAGGPAFGASVTAMREMRKATLAARRAPVVERPAIPSPCLEEAFQIQRSYTESAYWDAGFDGGEFSGPANADAEHRALEELASRYDIDVDDLLQAMQDAAPMTEDEAAGYGDSQERP